MLKSIACRCQRRCLCRRGSRARRWCLPQFLDGVGGHVAIDVEIVVDHLALFVDDDHPRGAAGTVFSHDFWRARIPFTLAERDL